MNMYNNIWTREKFLFYNQTKNIINNDVVYKDVEYLKEIIVNPEKTNYIKTLEKSKFYKNKYDHVLYFYLNNVRYAICLMYFEINNIVTYNVIFTTETQWKKYGKEYKKVKSKGTNITQSEWDNLNNIISKMTNLDELISVFKKISYIILDYYKKYLKNYHLSIGDTPKDNRRINLYRDIIKNSFPKFTESSVIYHGEKYYLYK